MAQLLAARLGHPVTDVVGALRVVLAKIDDEAARGGDLGTSSAVAHRLRNHLSALGALFFRIQTQGPLTDEQRELLMRCDDNAKRMTAIVTAVEDLTRLGAEPQPLETEAIDVTDLVEQVLESLTRWALRRQLRLGVDPHSAAPPFRSHRRLLQLVVTNLVETTATTTTRGPLLVRVAGTAAELTLVAYDDARRVETTSLRESSLPLARRVAEAAADGRELPILLLQRALLLLGGRAAATLDWTACEVTVPASAG